MCFFNISMLLSVFKKACIKRCIVFGLSVCALNVYSDETESVESTQCVDSSTTYKRMLLSSVNKKRSIQVDDKFFVNKVSEGDVLIDTRVESIDQQQILLRAKSALMIPLNQIKTKSYLKEEKVVLMGHGWDDYQLGYELDNLKKRGFKFVRILKHGVLSIVDNYLIFPYIESKLPLHKVSADKILATALMENDLSSFLFMNLGQKHAVFEKYGLQSAHFPYNEYDGFYQSLKQEVEQYIGSHEKLQVVITHDDPTIYSKFFDATKTIKNTNFWFINSGNKAVFALNKKIAASIIARNKVNVSCRS